MILYDMLLPFHITGLKHM